MEKNLKVGKSPRTIKVGGKEVLTKDFMDEYFIKRGYTQKDFTAVFGKGHRLWRNSRQHWYSKELLKELWSKKIAKSQEKNNSNKANYFKPRTILDLDQINEALGSSSTIKEAIQKLGVSKYVFQSNLQYYNISYNPKSVNRGIGIWESLSDRDKQTFKLIAAIQPELGKALTRGLMENTDLAKEVYKLVSLSYDIKNLANKLRTRQQKRLKNFNYPKNLSEYTVALALDSFNINYVCQYNIEGRAFDFYLPNSKYIIEVDGPHHTPEMDKADEVIINKAGLKMNRIKLEDFPRGNKRNHHITEAIKEIVCTKKLK